MVAIADHCLGCLGQQGMSVVQHYALHLIVPGELLLESTLRQTIRGTGELYDCMAGHALPAQKQCDPKRAVVPQARDCADAPSAVTYTCDMTESVGK
jgi:hypothetical protein